MHNNKDENGTSKHWMSEWKNWAVVALALITMALAWNFYQNSNSSTNKLNEFTAGKKITHTEFTEILATSPSVSILANVQGITNDKIRQNIYQCGIDFTGSTYMGSKNVTYYALSEEGCTSTEAKQKNQTNAMCIEQAIDSSDIIFYIHEGNESTFHRNGISVGITETYRPESCKVRIV